MRLLSITEEGFAKINSHFLLFWLEATNLKVVESTQLLDTGEAVAPVIDGCPDGCLDGCFVGADVVTPPQLLHDN